MGIRKWVLIATVLAVAVIAIVAAAQYVIPNLAENTESQGLIRAGGRIEGRTFEVSSKLPGRIVELLVDEGDELEANQLVARISSEEIVAQKKGAEANLALWEARRSQAELDLVLAGRNVKAAVDQAEAQLAVAKANLAQAQAAAEQAAKAVNLKRWICLAYGEKS